MCVRDIFILAVKDLKCLLLLGLDNQLECSQQIHKPLLSGYFQPGYVTQDSVD